jgi:long-chain acyl-CoA synthetase
MYQHSPLLQCLLHHAEATPEKTAFIVDGCEVTYAGLLDSSRKAAALLLNKGLKPGNRIVLSAHKDIEFVYLYFGAQLLGVTNVIVDASSNQERLNYIEQKTQPACCFGYESQQFTSCGFDQLGLDSYEAYKEDSPANISKDSIAEILFTTGTTGAPKGVCLSYANIFGSADNVNSFVGNTADDIEILGLPICHSFGLGTIRCNIIKGATVVLLGNFANVRQFFKAIEQYHGTGFRVVPAAWAYIRKLSGKRIEKYANQIKYI